MMERGESFSFWESADFFPIRAGRRYGRERAVLDNSLNKQRELKRWIHRSNLFVAARYPFLHPFSSGHGCLLFQRRKP